MRYWITSRFFEVAGTVTGLDPSAIAILTAGGTSGLILGLIVAVLAFAKGWVKPGSEVTEWKEIAKTSLATLDKITESVDKLTTVVERLATAYDKTAQEATTARVAAEQVQEMLERIQQQGVVAARARTGGRRPAGT
jgi:hypothetical protein